MHRLNLRHRTRHHARSPAEGSVTNLLQLFSHPASAFHSTPEEAELLSRAAEEKFPDPRVPDNMHVSTNRLPSAYDSTRFDAHYDQDFRASLEHQYGAGCISKISTLRPGGTLTVYLLCNKLRRPVVSPTPPQRDIVGLALVIGAGLMVAGSI
jgi:hypothetical protein